MIPTVGNREEGIDELKAAIARAWPGAEIHRLRRITVDYGDDIEGELAKLDREIHRDERLAPSMPPRWLALQLLEHSAEAKRAGPREPRRDGHRPAAGGQPRLPGAAPGRRRRRPCWPSAATASPMAW